MATAVAEGVREAGAEAVIKRVHELAPEEIARKADFRLDPPAPVASVADLPGYDAIIIGVPTRFGSMARQMKNFLDQTAVFGCRANSSKKSAACSRRPRPSTADKSTILSTHTVLLHQGMVLVGLPIRSRDRRAFRR